MKIFVYGTLKQGHWNNLIFKDSGVPRHSVSEIDGFRLVYASGRGSFPFAFVSPEGRIRGEVYDIGDNKECLRRLDALEGHPGWYIRTPAVTTDGQEVELYVMPEKSLRHNQHQECDIINSSYEWN